MKTLRRIPLFPLPNVVHFPSTDLRLHIFEPRYRRLVSDLSAVHESQRCIGMVLTKASDTGSEPAIHSGGTAGRLAEVEYLADGRSNIVLKGEFRFAVRQELKSEEPYRQAIVSPVEEPRVPEDDPTVMAVREEILRRTLAIATEVGDAFPIPRQYLVRSASLSLEEIVNGLCAHLDLPVHRKQLLLDVPLPQRALDVVSILKSRQGLLDLLRPYRSLAEAAGSN